jgi:hypothetical protein
MEMCVGGKWKEPLNEKRYGKTYADFVHKQVISRTVVDLNATYME